MRYNARVRRRFFVDQFDQNAKSAFMEGATAHHLGHVLRAQEGQLFELSDGAVAWLARVESIGRNRVNFALVEPLPPGKPSLQLSLLLAIVKFDAFEWALEKATELGVSRIVPLAAERSEKNLISAAAKRSERWGKILLESSQQSRRLSLPVLEPLQVVEEVFDNPSAGVRLLLSERADAPPVRSVLREQKGTSAALAIGPEGGWTDRELGLARQSGFREASLGSLILRTETAVITGLAVLNFALGAD